MSYDDPFRSLPYHPSWNPRHRDRPSKDKDTKNSSHSEKRAAEERDAELRKFIIETEFARHRMEELKLKEESLEAAAGAEKSQPRRSTSTRSGGGGGNGGGAFPPVRTRTNQVLDFRKYTEGKRKKGKEEEEAAGEDDDNQENHAPRPPPQEAFDPRDPDPQAQWSAMDPRKHDPGAQEAVLQLIAKRRAAGDEAEWLRKAPDATSGGGDLLGLVIRSVDERREKQDKAERKKEQSQSEQKQSTGSEIHEQILSEGMKKREAERKKLEERKKKAREAHPILDPFDHRDPESVRRALEVKKKRDAEVLQYLEEYIAKKKNEEKIKMAWEKQYKEMKLKEKMEKENAK